MSETEQGAQGNAQGVALSIEGLKVDFHTFAGDVKALDGVELALKKGEILGLVGESGCGKSVTALAVAGLLPDNAKVLGGRIMLEGQDLLKMSKSEMRIARLKEIAFVFQDPMTYLNPVLSVGSQLTEILTSDSKMFLKELVESRLAEIETMHKSTGGPHPDLEEEQRRLEVAETKSKLSKSEIKRLAKMHAINYLKMVRLPDPNRAYRMFPFELSGGMRQRAMIAMALVRRPKVLLADEITTALDVTVQAQVLKLLNEMKEEIDASVILITHDLAVVAEVCDRVAVMYAGSIVEVADVQELFSNPLHPYTRGLLESIPRPDEYSPNLKSIAGSVPNLIFPPPGCRFNPRCPKAFARCPAVKPHLIEASKGHFVACFLYGG